MIELSSNKVVLRAASFPIEKLMRLLQMDHDTFKDDLISTYKTNNHLDTAILLASHRVYKLLLEQYGKPNKDVEPKLLKTLTKYIIRSACRTTPYGTFSGVGIGELADKTSIRLAEFENSTIVNLPDGTLIHDVISKLDKKRIALCYNNTIYQKEDNFRYIEKTEGDGFQLSKVEVSEPLQLVLNAIKENSITFEDLLVILQKEGFDHQDSIEFLDSLIESGLILNINSFDTSISKVLEDLSLEHKEIITESGISEFIMKGDFEIGNYHKELNRCKDIIFSNVKKSKNPIQSYCNVSMYLSHHECKVSSSICKNLKEFIPILTTIGTSVQNEALEEFKGLFKKKFGDNYVPLLEALDPVMGIEYPHFTSLANYSNDLIDTLQLNTNGNQEYRPSLDIYQLEIILKAERENLRSIDLHDLNFNHGDYQNKLPDNFSLSVGLFQDSNDNPKIIFNSLLGPTSTKLIQRFNHHPSIRALIKELYNLEDELCSQKELIAEIVHVSEPRAINIVHYTHDRKFEIPVLAPGSKKSSSIHLDDIYVGIDGDIVKFYSKSLKKHIKPVLSNAFNYGNSSLPIYKFLCDAQMDQQNHSIEFMWSHELIDRPFLPRIEFKNIIVENARWNVPIEELDLSTFDTFCTDLEKINLKYRIPSVVSFIEFDQRILIDTGNYVCQNILFDFLKKYKQCILYEVPETEFTSISLNGTNEKLVNEVILFFHQKKDIPDSPIRTPKIGNVYEDQWLNLSLECMHFNTDKVLNILGEKINYELFQKWFFVRIVEEHHELRLRLLPTANNENLSSGWIFDFISSLLELGLIRDYSIKRYVREISRYGQNISLFESISHLDSEYYLRLFKILATLSPDDKIALAVYSLHQWLGCFLKTPQEKIEHIESVTFNFRNEFSFDKDFYKRLNKKYRRQEDTLNKIFADSEYLKDIKYVIQERSKQIRKLLELECYDPSKSRDFVFDVIHLHFMRFFITKQRFQESIVYEFLKIYLITNGYKGGTEFMDETTV
jgi:thiopeptide-type bacteriocin biosynthesis protein